MRHLGYFATLTEAHERVEAVLRDEHGEFYRTQGTKV